jgi:hypothetical protein
VPKSKKELSETIMSESPRIHRMCGLGAATKFFTLSPTYLGESALMGPNFPGATLGQLPKDKIAGIFLFADLFGHQ